MSSRSLIGDYLTQIEEQAHLEASRYFADQLKEFPASCRLLKHLEQDISRIALAALAVASKPPRGTPLLADDGLLWYKSLDLDDHIFVCYHNAIYGMEYSVVEQFPSGSNEIWIKGRNAVEVLKAFAHDQRRALQIWTEDMARQIKEFLAEKYPGEDLSRVADALMRGFNYAEHAKSASRIRV